MRIETTKILGNRLLIFLCSFVAAYNFWATINNSLISSFSATIPVYVYNMDSNNYLLSKKETQITIIGPRKDIKALKKNALAAFINGNNLKNGTNVIAIADDNLLLPDTLRLQKNTNLSIVVTVKDSLL